MYNGHTNQLGLGVVMRKQQAASNAEVCSLVLWFDTLPHVYFITLQTKNAIIPLFVSLHG